MTPDDRPAGAARGPGSGIGVLSPGLRLVAVTASVIRTAPWVRSAAAPFVMIGAACVIGGGLLSAAVAPMASYHSSWAVAYIVLIAGVAQAALGLGQARLTNSAVPTKVLRGELLGWNAGNAAVVAGTLLDVTPVLYLGCLLLIAALVLVLRSIAHAPAGRTLLTMRIIVVVLLVSMPTGIVIQALTG